MVAHASNARTQKAEAGGFCELKANLVYKANSRTIKTITQRIPVSERKKRQVIT